MSKFEEEFCQGCLYRHTCNHNHLTCCYLVGVKGRWEKRENEHKQS